MTTDMAVGGVTVALLLAIFGAINGLNIDTNVKSRVVHRSLKDTMFGYDVDMHSFGSGGLLVGAPRAQTGQPGVHRGGAVFSCSPERARCDELIFDRLGDNERLNGSVALPIDSKSDQWFGATVVSSRKEGQDSVFVKDYCACAPRYVWFSSTFDKKEPVGNCFHATNNFQNIQEFSPCKIDRKWGYHRLGYCMAGFSAALGNDNQAYISSPGAFYWGGSIMSQRLEDERSKVTHTHEGTKEYDDQYLGYSTASGDFNGDQIDDVAVGVPRGANLKGMVALYDHQLRNLENITGDQLGSYFGACIAVTDLNDDGLDDLVIGAPLFTKTEKGVADTVKSTYEIGKVHVYYQDIRHRFDKSVSIMGQREWSKFGYDVAAAGDLNGDGYNDFIVGAPFDGTDRRNGAVYIFNGGKEGIHQKFSQVIYGQLVQANIETFGFSVAGGRDVDKNGYPDIFVGAYKSDSAILLKTRPVIAISGYIRLSPDVIKLEDKSCAVVERGRGRGSTPTQNVACTAADICITYKGKNVPEDMMLRLLITLDAKKPNDPRARFLENSQFSKLTIEPEVSVNVEFCEKTSIFVEEGIRDKLSPIAIHVNYSVVEDRFRGQPFVPVVDTLNDGFLSADLKIWRDCGRDDLCIPDLQLTSATVSKSNIAIGSDDRFNLSIGIKNRLEHAYEAQVFVFTPKGVDFEKAIDNKGRPVVCTEKKRSDEYPNYDLLTCDLGNPMGGRNTQSNIILQYGTRLFEGPYDVVPIHIKTNSTNNETANTMHDNEKTVNITFSLDADLTVYGASYPETETFDIEGHKDPSTHVWDDDIGPSVNHTYQVINTGTTTFKDVVIDIYFPSHTYDGNNLLYIVDNVTLDDNYHTTQCDLLQPGNINPNHVGITKKVKSRPRRQIPEEDRRRILGDKLSGFHKLVEQLKSYTNKTGFPNLRGELAKLNVNCFDMNCTQWQCRVRDMKGGFSLSMTVEARLWTNTLIKEGFYGATVSSVVIAQVKNLPYKAPAGFELPIKHAVVTTTFIPSDPSRAERGIPWWVILVAVLAGLALLVLLILLMWRCGFFKRKRPPRGQALLAKPTESEYYGYSTYSPAAPNYPTHGSQPYGQRL